MARKEASASRVKLHNEALAAKKIQARFRGNAVRTQYQPDLQMLVEERAKRAARVIQASLALREDKRSIVEDLRAKQQQQIAIAHKLEADSRRMAIQNERVSTYQKNPLPQDHPEHEHAEELDTQGLEENPGAVVRIQAVYRGKKTREQTKEQLQDWRKRNVAAATKIQARGKSFARQQSKLEDVELEKAATRIQAVHRKKQAVQQADALRMKKAKH